MNTTPEQQPKRKHTRKLPIGWRRLTPTERITEECRWKDISHQQKSEWGEIDSWVTPWPEDINMTAKQNNARHPTYTLVFITPIRKQTDNEPKTNPTEQPRPNHFEVKEESADIKI